MRREMIKLNVYGVICGLLLILIYNGSVYNLKVGDMFVMDSPIDHSLFTHDKHTDFNARENRIPFLEELQRIPMDKDDAIVFLHIQKTGGTWFEYRMTQELQNPYPCVCKLPKNCTCNTAQNTTWLISRMATGWPCGNHNDWTELDECMDSKVDRMKMDGQLSKNAR